MSQLPELSKSPTRHPRSCASLSDPLLDLLNEVLPPPPNVTLSVGSGPGLLEALLLRRHSHRTTSLRGVEITAQTPVNTFLPVENIVIVPGTWAIASEADVADAFMFVYPRQLQLVAEYLKRGARAQTVVWIGPRCDVPEFTKPLRKWGEEDVDSLHDEAVLDDSEAVIVFRRR